LLILIQASDYLIVIDKRDVMQRLPIWRDANRLLVLIEEAVRRFPKYHKYALGTDLRRQAMRVCRLIMRAYHEKQERAYQVKQLIISIDDLKLLIQLGKELKAFSSFAIFPFVLSLSKDEWKNGKQRKLDHS
jgi:hypothetical protein